MRDPARIDRIVALLRKRWHQNPDLRLGQILVNALPPPTNDIFHLEDDRLEEELRKALKGT